MTPQIEMKYPRWKNLTKRIGTRAHIFLNQRDTKCGLHVIRIKRSTKPLATKCNQCLHLENLEKENVFPNTLYDPYWTHIPTRSAA